MALSIVDRDTKSSIDELAIDNSVSMHQRNLQLLSTEIHYNQEKTKSISY